jgi:thiol-disulfide isomerase/thioredoxin
MLRTIHQVLASAAILLSACASTGQAPTAAEKKPQYAIVTGSFSKSGLNGPHITVPDPYEMGLKNLAFDSQHVDRKQTFYVRFRCDSITKIFLFLKDVWVQPGDSVNVEYKVLNNDNTRFKDTLIFSGANLGGYVVYPHLSAQLLYKTTGYPFYSDPKYRQDSLRYWRDLNRFTQLQQEQVEALLQKHGASPALANTVRADIQQARLRGWLYYKSFVHHPVAAHYRDSFNMRPTNMRDYFNTLRPYHLAAAWQKGTDETSAAYYQSLFTVANGFTGLNRDLLYLHTVLQLPKINQTDNPALLQSINDSMAARVQTPDIRARLLEKLGKQPNMDNSDVALTTLDGQNLPFDDMLKRYAGKAIYLDFWASWCLPCRGEFPASRQLIQRHPDVAYVFVSIDTDVAAWKKAVDKEALPKENCYLMSKEGYEKITQRFGFSGVPYYALYSPSGQLTIKNAPRPSSGNIGQVLRSVVGNK